MAIPPLRHLLVLFETEESCRARLEADGFPADVAEEIALYLAQATDLAGFYENLRAAFQQDDVAVHFCSLEQRDRYLPLLDRYTKEILLWCLTDGFRYYRGSAVTGLASLLQVPTFGNTGQAQYLCQDKFKVNRLLDDFGIPSPPTFLCRDGEFVTPPPAHDPPAGWFVKPNTLGSKIGIWPDSRCRSLDQARLLSQRIYARYRDDAVVQPFLPGDDVRVSYLNAGPADERDRLGIYRLRRQNQDGFMTVSESRAATTGTSSDLVGRAERTTRLFQLENLATSKDQMAGEIVVVAHDVYTKLKTAWKLQDYFSLDLRITPDGVPYVLEFEVCPAVTIYDFQAYLQDSFGLSLGEALRIAVQRAFHRWHSMGNCPEK